MRDICAGQLRADPRRAPAWRLRAILILILAAAVAAACAPRSARAVSYGRSCEDGGGCLTGDPDDGEHKTGPSRLPVELDPAGDLPSPTTQLAPTAAGTVPQDYQPSLPAAGRAALLQALMRCARPLAWLALSTRQPWTCDPLWLATLQSPAPSPAQPTPRTKAFARTR